MEYRRKQSFAFALIDLHNKKIVLQYFVRRSEIQASFGNIVRANIVSLKLLSTVLKAIDNTVLIKQVFKQAFVITLLLKQGVGEFRTVIRLYFSNGKRTFLYQISEKLRRVVGTIKKTRKNPSLFLLYHPIMQHTL